MDANEWNYHSIPNPTLDKIVSAFGIRGYLR